jgi:hypothetical protein
MSDTKTINRREAMRMLGASFMGSAILGSTTYFATDLYQRELAELDVEAALTAYPKSISTKKELMTLTEKERQDTTNGYTKAAAALGGLIGSEHYDWDMPSPFSVEPN